MQKRRFAALAFECLICPPFALNIIRTVAVNIVIKEDLAHAAQRIQGLVEWRVSSNLLAKRLTEAMEIEDENSERLFKLEERRRKLLKDKKDVCN